MLGDTALGYGDGDASQFTMKRAATMSGSVFYGMPEIRGETN
jgi:hypothetical protein